MEIKIKKGERRFVVEGRLCVERLLSSTLDVESLLVQEGKESEVQRVGLTEIYLFMFFPKVRSASLSDLISIEASLHVLIDRRKCKLRL